MGGRYISDRIRRATMRMVISIGIITLYLTGFATNLPGLHAQAFTGDISGRGEYQIVITSLGYDPVGPGNDKHIGEGIAERIKEVPYMARIEKYLYYVLDDKSKVPSRSVIVGMTPGDSLWVSGYDPERGSVILGRGFKAGDKGRSLVILGRGYAKKYSLTVSSKFNPLGPKVKVSQKGSIQRLWEKGTTPRRDTELQAIGIFKSASSFGENHIFIPLKTAQTIADHKDHVSLIIITVDKPENREFVADSLRDILAGAVGFVFKTWTQRESK